MTYDRTKAARIGKLCLAGFVLLLILSLVPAFCGCVPRVMVVPDNASIGEPRTFEKDGITLTLTDRFVEKESELGFYGYYVSDFCGVVVMKEDFSLEEGMAALSPEEYTANVIANNGYTGVKPQSRDGLWFYEGGSGSTRNYSYIFKGSDAFWIVQYLCMSADAPAFEDLFFLWASGVEVE